MPRALSYNQSSTWTRRSCEWKSINITTHFIHSRGFSFVEETCGKKMRAPLLGLPKSIYYSIVLMKLILLKDVRAMCIFYCTYKVISLKDVQAMCIDKNKFIFFLTECLPSARHSAIQRRKYVMASYWIVYERWANQSKRGQPQGLTLSNFRVKLTDIMVDSKQSREYIAGKYRPRVDKSLITSLP